MTEALAVTDRTRLLRMKDNARKDRREMAAILAAGFVCHLGVTVDGVPRVFPTVYGADGETLYVHGSVASRSLVHAPASVVCVTVTHVDGLVLARSVFEHSINYRCVMAYGVPRVVTDPEEKLRGLELVTEQCAPGQWAYARQPNRKELAATTLLALRLDEVSVKVRQGPPDDGDSPDAELGLWAGVVPIASARGVPIPDPVLPAAVALPAHVRAMS